MIFKYFVFIYCTYVNLYDYLKKQDPLVLLVFFMFLFLVHIYKYKYI